MSLDIAKGELFALLGGSGCGKTTLLRMLAGFETPTAGRIFIDGQDMTGVPPYERPVNMMFQSYALFPHMTVEKNVGYGLKHDPMTEAQRQDRVSEMLDLVQLAELGARKPHQLSGGQRQRVALARALAQAAEGSAARRAAGRARQEAARAHPVRDRQYPGQDRHHLRRRHPRPGRGDDAGRPHRRDGQGPQVRQIGTPTEVYEYPKSRFVADFIGSINMFDGARHSRMRRHGTVEVPELGAAGARRRASAASSAGQGVKVAVRPEKIAITRERPPEAPTPSQGMVQDLGYFGKDSLYRVQLDTGAVLSVNSVNARRVGESERVAQWEDRVWLSFEPSAGILLTD